MDEGSKKALESIAILGGLLAATSVAAKMLTPKAKPKAERLCGYHLGSMNRRSHLSVLDSENCEMCKAEGALNV